MRNSDRQAAAERGAMPTVIFDLDGTLADTSGDLIAAANACFRGTGAGDVLDPATDQLTAFKGGRAMLRLGLARLEGQADDIRVEALFPILLENYAASLDYHTRLYPGAVAAIEALRRAGVHTGICTNKPEALATELVDRLGATPLFDSLIGADTLTVRKPDPAPYLRAVSDAGGMRARSIMIGDTANDRDTARAAGVPCVLVAFGPQGAATAALDPDALLDHYDRLAETIAPFIGL